MEEQTLLKLDVFTSGDIKKCEKWNLQTRTDQVWGPVHPDSISKKT
jgi:hypothetical protein